MDSTPELTLLVAAAIAKAGFPRSRESAHDYRMRLARAALRTISQYETKKVSPAKEYADPALRWEGWPDPPPRVPV